MLYSNIYIIISDSYWNICWTLCTDSFSMSSILRVPAALFSHCVKLTAFCINFIDWFTAATSPWIFEMFSPHNQWLSHQVMCHFHGMVDIVWKHVFDCTCDEVLSLCVFAKHRGYICYGVYSLLPSLCDIVILHFPILRLKAWLHSWSLMLQQSFWDGPTILWWLEHYCL